MAVSRDIRKRLLYAKYLLFRAKKAQTERNELAIAASMLLMRGPRCYFPRPESTLVKATSCKKEVVTTATAFFRAQIKSSVNETRSNFAIKLQLAVER
jgi:hypothetical protein